MPWTIEERANYITRAVMAAWKEDRNIEEAIKKALEEIIEYEKGSGWSGI